MVQNQASAGRPHNPTERFFKPLRLEEVPGRIYVTFDTCSNQEPEWMEALGPLLSRLETNESLRSNDQGEQRVKNLECVNAEKLVRGLRNNGYYLVGMKRVNKRTAVAGQLGHLKVTFIYGKEGEPIDELPEVTKARRALANQTWNYLHVWLNPAEFGSTATINFVKPNGNRRAQNSYAIEDGEFVARPI